MKSPARFLSVLAVAALVSFAGCEEDDDLVDGMDLKVVALRIPSQTSLTQGSSVTLTVLVRNRGTVVIDKPFVTRIDFYENAALTVPSAWDSVEVSYPDDVTYPEDDTGDIDSDVTVAFEVETVVDASNPPQLVFCKVTCDTGDPDAVFEADEGNNSLVEVCQVLPGTGGGGGGGEDPTPTAGPDLVISSMTVPDQAIRGGTITISLTVRNDGDETVTVSDEIMVNVTVYDSLSYVNELWLPQEETENIVLGPTETTGFDFSFSVDKAEDLGPAYVVATVSCAADADPGNNTATDSFSIVDPPKPDLVVILVESSDTYVTGTAGGLKVDFKLKNDGDAKAYGSMAHVLICHEDDPLVDAVFIGEKAVDGLEPAEESGLYTVNCTYDAPVVGYYKVYVKADGLNILPESNEDNNCDKCYTTFIHGVPAADLAVSIVYLSPIYDFSDLADRIDVDYTVVNLGPVSSGPSWVGIRLIDQGGGQAQTWGPFAVPQVDAYGSYTATQSLLPSLVSPLDGEPYVLTLTADLQDDVAESNEANNTTSGTVLMY